MSKFATKQKFGGQVASVCRMVLLAAPSHKDPTKMCLRAGVVLAISSSQDTIYIKDLGSDDATMTSVEWTFVSTGCPADAEAMPIGSWTWPPRV